MTSPTNLKHWAGTYLGGLAHVHTRVSNYRGHFESDQNITSFINTLREDAPGFPLQFVMLNEHSSNPTRPHRLGKFSIRARRLLRKRWITHIEGVPILHGFEANLLPDGTTDLSAKLEANAEMVIASRHKLPPEYKTDAALITRQLKAACANPQIDVLGHPLRHIESVKVDWAEIFETAAGTGTAIEINLNNFPLGSTEPERLEIWAQWLDTLGASGAQAFIGSDLHNKLQLARFTKDWQALSKPGRPNRLEDFLTAISKAGITPERVVNANIESFYAWLEKPKPDRA